MADKGDGFPCLHLEGNILQDIPFSIIGKADMTKFNPALAHFQIGWGLCRFVGPLVHHGKDPLSRNHGGLQGRKILCDFNQGVKKLIDILDKGIHETSCKTSCLPI